MKLYERIENNNFDEIDRNRAIELIEGGNGHLVYNENYFKLQKENEELKSKLSLKQFDINVVYSDYLEKLNEYKENSISVQKVKDKIEYLDNQQKQWIEDRKLKESDSEIIFARDILKELLRKE